MRELKILVIGALILMTSCEKSENYLNQPKSTINNRFSRQITKECETPLRTIKYVSTKKPTINLVKSLNVRPLLAGNPFETLNPTNIQLNANNIKAKRPIAVNKLVIPRAPGENKPTIEINNDKNQTKNRTKKDEQSFYEKKHENITIEEKVNHTQTEAAPNKIEAKEYDYHKETPKTTPNKVEVREQDNHIISNIIENESTKPEHHEEFAVKLNEETTTLKLENKQPLTVISKSDENVQTDPIKNILKQVSNKMSLSPKETSNEVLEKAVQTPINELNEELDTPEVEIAKTLHINTGQDTNDNVNKTNTDDSATPLLMTLDKSLKLEGGEEIVIQNNNYEELYETDRSAQYGTPKLIQSELRPSPWSESFDDKNNVIEQYVDDDPLKRYNQYIDTTYNGLKDKYNNNYNPWYKYNNNYNQWSQGNSQPQAFGQWSYYQARPYGRIWRSWRNNQIFIRPKTQYRNMYGQIPSTIIGSSKENQDVYPSNAPTCSCGFHGY